MEPFLVPQRPGLPPSNWPWDACASCQGLARLTWTPPPFQLSVYTTTRSHLGTENNIDLVLNVEDFDVESKFERYGCRTKCQ